MKNRTFSLTLLLFLFCGGSLFSQSGPPNFHRLIDFNPFQANAQNFTLAPTLDGGFVMVTSDLASFSSNCAGATQPKPGLTWSTWDPCLESQMQQTWEDGCPPMPNLGDTLIARDVFQDSDSFFVVCGAHKYGELPLAGFVLRADPAGNIQWFRRLPMAMELLALLETEDKTGYLSCGVGFPDGLVFKIDKSGLNIPWIHAFEVGAMYDMARGNNDEFVMVGSEWGPPNQAGFNYSSDVEVVKMRDSGVPLDNWIYGRPTTVTNIEECDSSCQDQIFSEIGRGIFFHNDTVIVTGELVTRPLNCLQTDSVDLLLFSLDYGSGAVHWANSYNLYGTSLTPQGVGGAWDRAERGEKVIVTQDRRIVVAGNAVHHAFATGSTPAGSFEGFIFACELDGTQDTVTLVGSEQNDFLMRLEERSDSIPIVAGYTQDSSGSAQARVVVYYPSILADCQTIPLNPGAAAVPMPLRTSVELPSPDSMEIYNLLERGNTLEEAERCEVACVYDASGGPDSCYGGMTAQNDHSWYMDTAAKKLVHPFLFEGVYFEENNIRKVIYPIPVPYAANDFILCKARETGEVEWTISYGTSGYTDVANAIVQISDGKFAVTGTSRGFDDHKNYPFLMKIDAAGQILWQHTYPNGHHLGRMDVVELNNGNFALCGYQNRWSYAETCDPVLLVTDPLGALQTYRRLLAPAREWDHFRGLTATSDGGFVVCGSYGHSDDYVGALVAKYAANGSQQWERVYRVPTSTGNYDLSSSNPADRSHLIFSDILEHGGMYYVAGSYLNPRVGGGQPTFRKAVIGQVGPGGNPGWFLTLHRDSTLSYLYNMDFTSSGAFVLTGKTRNLGQQRTWLVKTDVSGTPLFSNVYGGGHLEFGSWVTEGSNQQLIVNGFRRHTNSNGSFRAYNMRVDGQGKGNAVCQDTAQLKVRTLQVEPIVIQPSYETGTGDISSAFGQTPVCIPARPCTASFSKMAVASVAGQEAAWLAFPNPGRNRLALRRQDGVTGATEIRLLDHLGRQVFWTETEAADLKLETGHLPAGMYFIQLQSAVGMQVIRWLKQ